MTDQTVQTTEAVAPDEFDKVSKAGWNGFTRFLLINVIVIALTLVFVAALTVWS
jgi:hypothetical protein